MYAIGAGLRGTATHPRPPRNLCVGDQSNGTVQVYWDDGLADPAILERYDLYVDGEQWLSITESPN